MFVNQAQVQADQQKIFQNQEGCQICVPGIGLFSLKVS